MHEIDVAFESIDLMHFLIEFLFLLTYTWIQFYMSMLLLVEKNILHIDFAK